MSNAFVGTVALALAVWSCNNGATSGATNGDTTTGGTGGSGESAAGSAGVPVGLGSTCSGICNAATPSYPVVNVSSALGNVTMYSTSASSGGACLYGATNTLYYAAMSVNVEPGDGRSHWQEGRICGQCARVTALTSQGPKQVIVRIMDKCPDGFCGIDLGGSAPESIMVDGFGRYDGAWEFVSCAGHPEVFDGPTSLFVKDGSNAYWSAVQVRNPPMSVSAMDYQNRAVPSEKGSFSYASPQIENYYLVPSDVLQAKGTFDITVTYRDGSTATLTLTSTELATAESSYSF